MYLYVKESKMPNNYRLEIYPRTAAAEAHYKGIYGEGVSPRGNENAGVDVYTFGVEDKGAVRMVHSEIVAKLIDTVAGKAVHYYLAPRSSIWKSGVTMANSMGIIDASYRGELMGACLPIPGAEVKLAVGDRLFQILAPDMGHISSVVVRPLAELDATARGAGGFGSSGA
jgi:deoxyuridine 5'-triphosphate nucleotidohydrolase